MSALYDDILRITRDYMGIVAESFVARRCKNSLNLDDPRLINQEHLDLFTQGVVQTGEVYMKAEKVREFAVELMRLRDRPLSTFRAKDWGGEFDANDNR